MLEEAYSSLEVLYDDQPTNAPQRDHTRYPPELDRAVLAPQVLPYTGPEIRYENSLPEVLDVIGLYSSAHRASRQKETISAAFRRHCRRPSNRRLVLFICMALVTVAIIVVVNVRLGLVTNNESASGTSSTLTQTPSEEKPTTGISFFPSGIFNDSALAAVELSNGDRRVFFQENSGNIRQAVYQRSRNQWSASLTDIIVSDAKIYTPLAAIALNKTDEIVIQLFYITSVNTLSYAAWFSIKGWRYGDVQFERFNKASAVKVDRSAAVNTRQLSVSSTQSPLLQVYLFYENSNGNLTVLRTSNPEGAYDLTDNKSYWIDITNYMIDQLGRHSSSHLDLGGVSTKPSFNFAAPISFSSLGRGIYPANDVLVVYLAVESSSKGNKKSLNALCRFDYCDDDGIGRRGCENFPPNCDEESYPQHDLPVELRKLDLKIVSKGGGGSSEHTAIWTNTSIQTLSNSASPKCFFGSRLDPPFPFSRLAAISLINTPKEENGGGVAVYNQISDDILLENLWQPGNNIWVKTKIEIPISLLSIGIMPHGHAEGSQKPLLKLTH